MMVGVHGETGGLGWEYGARGGGWGGGDEGEEGEEEEEEGDGEGGWETHFWVVGEVRKVGVEGCG